MIVTIRGHEEIFFDFRQTEARDDCTVILILGSDQASKSTNLQTDEEIRAAEAARAENMALLEARISEPSAPEQGASLATVLGEIGMFSHVL